MQTRGYTVYIVEDDQSVRDALGLLLGLRGYAVSRFADAESFLSAYRPEWRGCLLADIRMPGMDGIALQKCLLQDGRSLPVIVMTGHGTVEVHKARMLSKLEVDGVPDLVRLSLLGAT